jgi:hypothetical protein
MPVFSLQRLAGFGVSAEKTQKTYFDPFRPFAASFGYPRARIAPAAGGERGGGAGLPGS